MGQTGGLPVERVHDILHRDAATNFRTFGPKSGGGAKVMVDGKDVGGRLTKADFAVHARLRSMPHDQDDGAVGAAEGSWVLSRRQCNDGP